MEWTVPAAIFSATAVATVLATAAALSYLRRRAILDAPNERSSHARPTPVGGGLAVVPVIVLAIAAASWGRDGAALGLAAAGVSWVIAGAVFLAVVSWIDDLSGLSPVLRLAAHAAAVAAVLIFAPPPGLALPGIGEGWPALVIVGVAWVWFINLFNFMDGIDGLAGAETGAIGLGFALIAFSGALDAGTGVLALALAAAGLGFLWWNWHPARIFLGDVGAVPLGFLLGWLLVRACAQGQWAAALILPLYYWADATLTLILRVRRGEAVWRAHRDHFYQRAVRRGLGHARVVVRIAAANAVLVVLALVAASGYAALALAAAAVVVAALLVNLRGGMGRVPRPGP